MRIKINLGGHVEFGPTFFMLNVWFTKLQLPEILKRWKKFGKVQLKYLPYMTWEEGGTMWQDESKI